MKEKIATLVFYLHELILIGFVPIIWIFHIKTQASDILILLASIFVFKGFVGLLLNTSMEGYLFRPKVIIYGKYARKESFLQICIGLVFILMKYYFYK